MILFLVLVVIAVIGFLLLQMLFRDTTKAVAGAAALSQKQGNLPWWQVFLYLLIGIGFVALIAWLDLK
jgi:hypothetical protein